MTREEAIEILTEIQTKHKKYIGQTECNNALNMAIEALQVGWIPISIGLPEEKGTYLVTYHPCRWDNVSEEVCVGIDTFRGKAKWAREKYQRIIAWMPLPEPYKAESEE